MTGATALEGRYKGTMAGGYPNESASLDLTMAASTTGTIKLVGAAPMAVTGTYVAATQVVTVSGGGFTITGTIDNTGKLVGTYTHSSRNDKGGKVAGYQHTTANAVTVFCGTYAGYGGWGIWNLVSRGSSLSGAYVNIDGSDGYLTGTVSGNSISITDIEHSPAGGALGTLSGTTMSGTWSVGGYGGTWISNTTC